MLQDEEPTAPQQQEVPTGAAEMHKEMSDSCPDIDDDGPQLHENIAALSN